MMIKTQLCSAAIAAVLAISMVGGAGANEAGCVTSYDASKDYFPDKVEVKHGAGFSITYTGNTKRIRNDVSGETYVLYQCGTPAPADIATKAGSLQVGNWTKVASVPPKKIALDSAPASAIVEMLGVQSTVAASYKFFTVTSPCMQKQLAELPRVAQSFSRKRGLVRRVSYDVADAGAEWTFTTYGMSDPQSFALNPDGARDMLGKAEWIKFVAAFFNKEAEANKIFADIESRYTAARDKLASRAKKTVGFARYNKVANGTVVSWTIDQPQAWVVQGMADARLSAHSGATTAFNNIDAFYAATADWDVLIDGSIEPLSHGGATIPLWQNLRDGYKFGDGAKNLPYVTANAIYRSDLISSPQNATDYNEHLQIQVDALLEDFAKLASDSGATDTTWYRNLPHQVQVDWRSPGDCKN
ncbi:hypothetical protein IW148_002547 [Coemansia sp. RSA 1199]|nr:hypothetical protein IW148_002547 [Coemansia sp. RSA 1199]